MNNGGLLIVFAFILVMLLVIGSTVEKSKEREGNIQLKQYEWQIDSLKAIIQGDSL